MKITFIGTSHGVPAADRFCSCILIETGGSFYFIDAGAPIADVVHRRNLDFNNFKGVFTTHSHGDHTSGIFQVADLINWYYKSAEVDFFLTKREQAETVERLIEVSSDNTRVDRSRIRFKIAAEGEVYDDGRIKVEYIRNCHMIESPSYSILVTAEGKRVLFSGDFSNNLRGCDVPKGVLSCGVDAFVCELAHFSLAELAPYIEGANMKRLFFTHVYPLSKYGDIEGWKGKYPFEIVTPRDGDEYEI